MANSLQVTTNLSISRTHSSQADENGPVVTDNNTWRLIDSLANGTGSNQATSAFHDIRTLTASNLDGIGLVNSNRDAFGTLIPFTAIKCIAIKHLTPGADDSLQIGGGGDPLAGWVADTSDKVLIRPGGAFIWWGPKAGAVISGSTDFLVENLASTTVQYEILFIGTTS